MIKIGNTEIINPMIGNTQIIKRYVGNTLVWERAAGYDADAQNYFDRLLSDASFTPTITQKNYVNTYIVGLKAAGIWSKITGRYLMFWNNALAVKVPLKAGVPVLAAVGTPTHYNDGTIGVYDSGVAGTDTTLNDIHLIIYSKTDLQNNSHGDIGARSIAASSNILVLMRTSSNVYSSQIYGSSGGYSALTNIKFSIGCFHSVRAASNDHKVFINGVKRLTVSTVNTGTLPTHNLAIGGWNNLGSFTSPGRKFFLQGWGLSLTETEVTADRELTETLMVNRSMETRVFDTDALSYISRVEAKGKVLNDHDRIWVDDLIVGLKADGVWDDIYDFGLTHWAHAGANSVPIKNIAPEATWYGGLNHTANGITTDGTTGYGDLGILPSVRTNYNTHMGVYQRVAASTNTNDIGARSSSNGQVEGIVLRTSSTCRYYGYSTSSTNGMTSASGTAGQGLTLGVRRSTTDSRLYMKGLPLGTVNTAVATTLLPTAQTVFYPGFNNNGTPNFSSSLFEFILWTMGNGLTDAQALAYSNRVELFFAGYNLSIP